MVFETRPEGVDIWDPAPVVYFSSIDEYNRVKEEVNKKFMDTVRSVREKNGLPPI